MNKKIIAAISLLVPIAGIVIFFVQLGRDKKAAYWALIWAMAGMAVALAVLIILLRYL